MSISSESEPTTVIDECIEGDAVIIRVRDRRLDTRSAPLVGKRLSLLIHSGHRRMALEMSRVELIDSSGLSVLVSVEHLLGGHGGFVISSPSETVMSILRLTRLARILRVYPNEQQALAALSV